MGRGRPADLGQDPGSVGLGGRLDQASGDHLLKGPVTPDRLPQPQTPVGRTEGLDQPGRPARDDLRPSHRTTVTGCLTTHLVSVVVECRPQVQDLLAGQEPLAPQAHQRSQLGLVMGRPQVLHDPAHTTVLGHDLHGRGPRGCPDLANKRAHTSAPYGLLVPHHQTPNTAIPTKTHAKSPKTHQGVTSQVLVADLPGVAVGQIDLRRFALLPVAQHVAQRTGQCSSWWSGPQHPARHPRFRRGSAGSDRCRGFGRRSPGRPRSAAGRRPAACGAAFEDQVAASLGDGANQVDVALLLRIEWVVFERAWIVVLGLMGSR